MTNQFDINTFLVSDEIADQLNTEEVKDSLDASVKDSFIIAVAVFSSQAEVAGSVLGMSFESDGKLKIDIRTSIKVAYGVVKSHADSEGKLYCTSLSFDYDGVLAVVNSHKSVASVRIFDIDHASKMCTLGIDFATV